MSLDASTRSVKRSFRMCERRSRSERQGAKLLLIVRAPEYVPRTRQSFA
jgi:hypothetical protein